MKQGTNKPDSILKAAGQTAAAALEKTAVLVGRGVDKAEQIALERRLAKAQRQLGIWIYTCEKTQKKADKALLKQYVKEIDTLKLKLAGFEQPPEPGPTVYTVNRDSAPEGSRFVAVASTNYPQSKAAAFVWQPENSPDKPAKE